MAEAKEKYRRLTGSQRLSRGLAVRNSLWLSQDYLLSVSNQGYSEDYKRFRFKDIQAIIIRRTYEGAAWNIVMAFIVALILVIATLIGDRTGFFVGLVTSSPILLLLIINSLLGPTCRCHLRTAVQVEPLRALSRLRGARKAVEELRLRIEAVQGPQIQPATDVEPDQPTAGPDGAPDEPETASPESPEPTS